GELGQRQPVQIAREASLRRQVARRGFSPDADHADVFGADVRVRIDRNRSHVDERARLHDRAPVANEVETFGEGLCDAGAVDHDVGACVRVLTDELDALALSGTGRIYRQ